MEKEKKPKSKAMGCLMAILVALLLILAIGLIGAFAGGDDDEKPKQETEQEEEVDANGWTKDDKVAFMTITQTISDKFIDDYKSPWGLDGWTFAKFDDSGKIVVSTDYTLKDTSVKQPVVCIFTWNEEEESYKAHFLSIGDYTFLNDGSCDDFFNKLSEMASE